mgnify:CR=1 FL=1
MWLLNLFICQKNRKLILNLKLLTKNCSNGNIMTKENEGELQMISRIVKAGSFSGVHIKNQFSKSK